MLESGGLTTATLWKLTRRDGQVFGFTDHNEDVAFGGLTYDANTSYNRTATADNAGLAVSNMVIDSILDSNLITEEDIIAGLWDYAQVEMRYVNWHDRRVLHISNITKALVGVVTTREPHELTTGDTVSISGVGGMAEVNGVTFTATVIDSTSFSIGVNTAAYSTYLNQGEVRIPESSWGYRKGRIGQVNTSGQSFSAELMGIAKKLEKPLARPYLPGCPAALGDSECTVNLAAHTVTGTLTAVDISGIVLSDPTRTESDNAFAYGLITMTSGDSNGYSMEVKSSDNGGTITLQQPLPFGVGAGDTYSLVKGCDKTLSTCKNTFNNVVNFRGFPHLPGMDKLVQYAG